MNSRRTDAHIIIQLLEARTKLRLDDYYKFKHIYNSFAKFRSGLNTALFLFECQYISDEELQSCFLTLHKACKYHESLIESQSKVPKESHAFLIAFKLISPKPTKSAAIFSTRQIKVLTK